jgi:FtsH-binding integral membrane protein
VQEGGGIVKTVLRDVAIIFGLTLIGGVIVGVALDSEQNKTVALAVSTILFGIIGFCISGALIKVNRFNHLLKVAIGFWILGIVNVLFGKSTIIQWASSIIVILILMGIGGGLSYLFSRSPSSSA